MVRYEKSSACGTNYFSDFSGITIPIAKSFSGVRRLTITRSAGATSASGAPLNSAVTRLPQAPTNLPTDSALVDEHDIRAAVESGNKDGPNGITKGSPTSTERPGSSSPIEEQAISTVQKTDVRPTLEVKPEGMIRFRSTVAVEGELRPTSDLHGAEEERLTKRAKEIHGTLPT